MPLMITEALAEIKTLGKRIEKKREFIGQFLGRQDGIRDPLEKDGGSATRIRQELQAVFDLEKRIVDLRRGIQLANEATSIAVTPQDGKPRANTIADWLVWRRDVAPNQKEWLARIRGQIAQLRQKATQQGAAFVQANATTADTKPIDFIINLSEADLATDAEALEDVLGQLDGQLSLKNATTPIVETLNSQGTA